MFDNDERKNQLIHYNCVEFKIKVNNTYKKCDSSKKKLINFLQKFSKLVGK